MNKSPKDLKKFMRSLENYMSFILGAITYCTFLPLHLYSQSHS